MLSRGLNTKRKRCFLVERKILMNGPGTRCFDRSQPLSLVKDRETPSEWRHVLPRFRLFHKNHVSVHTYVFLSHQKSQNIPSIVHLLTLISHSFYNHYVQACICNIIGIIYCTMWSEFQVYWPPAWVVILTDVGREISFNSLNSVQNDRLLLGFNV